MLHTKCQAPKPNGSEEGSLKVFFLCISMVKTLEARA